AESWGERVACLGFPIRDLSIPSEDRMQSILDAIDLSLAAKRPVLVHCYGGVGRTGTVIGCWLRRHRLANAGSVLPFCIRFVRRMRLAVIGGRRRRPSRSKWSSAGREGDDDGSKAVPHLNKCASDSVCQCLP